MASTVPMVMNTLAWTLRRLVALQYTARRAVRSPSVSPTLAATLRPADSTAKWATPVATNPRPATSTARRRSTALRTATTKHPTESAARGATSHPASDETRIVVSSGVLWEMPTSTSSASSGSASASSGLVSSRLWRTSGVALWTLTMRRLRCPSTIARCSSRHPGVEHALEPVRRHELRNHHFEGGPCVRCDARNSFLLLDGGDDLLRDYLAHRRLLEHVGGDVGEPLGVGECPPAPQRDHREVGEQQPEQ